MKPSKKTPIIQITKAIKETINCRATPTTKNIMKVQEHASTMGAMKSHKRADDVKAERCNSTDIGVYKKPPTSLSNMRRTFGVIRKSDMRMALRTKWTENNKTMEKDHGNVKIPASLNDWTKEKKTK
ncbi:hypothetical protein F2Q70_00030580 [Brassica cretica]|uniref:Uncharacterized protein n=1 Tax=Brassica cretica TaxID=69181 RepID=A0A8S9H2G0_BRACR|nr:hypothetical protein F2Q70_00030580 [Brassica cretica]KAF2552243.1 hypothetical protein F2Q68_00035028 [Brassica cretica]